MADSNSPSDASLFWQDMHSHLKNVDAGLIGPTMKNFLDKRDPSAKLLSDVYLQMDNPNALPFATNDRVRERLKIWIDAKLVAEQIGVQQNLADSNDRLGKRMLFAAWAGVAVALAGVLVAIV
ncbi:hypothetical protein [Dyella mobilis]|uniref:Uncharacterized protein n=1 Tax=Dyella mobilis TaxID=1849582 RepID=A0ABS2KKA5_9GAMM|nr:hypothetical protein [Dyella mobilis]MBM7131601.1 hypothetical protein [Dyella mobilis]GLQ96424.1 hypothetical protein GCM10007863_08420 [Dyella mobilis]